MKRDETKTRWSHIPWEGLEGAANIITEKAIKFKEKRGKPEWCELEDNEYRYLDALIRHIVAIQKGESMDPDSERPHTEHLIANSIIIDDIMRKKSSLKSI